MAWKRRSWLSIIVTVVAPILLGPFTLAEIGARGCSSELTSLIKANVQLRKCRKRQRVLPWMNPQPRKFSGQSSRLPWYDTEDTASRLPWCRRGGGGNAATKGDDDENGEPYFTIPRGDVMDPFVRAAPLIVAATCRDGSVALVAVHTQPLPQDESNNSDNDPPQQESTATMTTEAATELEEEPFLYESILTSTTKTPASSSRTTTKSNDTPPESTASVNNSNKTSSTSTSDIHEEANNNNKDDQSRCFLDRYSNVLYDLPRSFGGPTRICSLDGSGLVLLVTGWRADCDTLALQARKIVQRDRATLGESPCGHVLSSKLSLYLAQRAGSEQHRPLSCVALVVAPPSLASSYETFESSKEIASPQIWLTDPTGAYPVRALAVGRDAACYNNLLVQKCNDNGSSQDLLTAGDESLVCSWETGKDGIKSLLSILAETVGGGARVELAIMQSNTDNGSDLRSSTRMSKADRPPMLVRLQLEDL
ncbi:hypothetical protein ACA910_003884 [Epithemia clementina (nom. ined.)]